VFTLTPPDGHQGSSSALQSCPDASEVQIEQAWACDELADSLNALAKHIICHTQRDIEGHDTSNDRQKAIIWDHNK
jgi:hypothetical protein